MNLEDYRTMFASVGFVLMLIAASPVLGMILPFSGVVEPLSELWVVGPSHMAEGYIFNMTMGEEEQVFVGVENHMGASAYYAVCVKLRNRTQAAPDSTTSTPSPLVSLYEFRTFVADGEAWEVPVTFSFVETSRLDDSLVINRIAINDAVFVVDYASTWDSENMGFFYQLFFELWIYNANLGFKYHNRFVGMWLNMTG